MKQGGESDRQGGRHLGLGSEENRKPGGGKENLLFHKGRAGGRRYPKNVAGTYMRKSIGGRGQGEGRGTYGSSGQLVTKKRGAAEGQKKKQSGTKELRDYEKEVAKQKRQKMDRIGFKIVAVNTGEERNWVPFI